MRACKHCKSPFLPPGWLADLVILNEAQNTGKKIKCSAEKPCESCNERGIECEVQRCIFPFVSLPPRHSPCAPSQPHLNPNPANSPLKYHYSLSYIKSKEQKTIALVAIPCENTSTNGLPPNHERKDPNTIFNGAPKFGAGFGIKPQSEVSLVVSQSPDAFSFHLPETRKTDTNFTYLCSMLIPNHGKQLIIWAPWSENKHGEGMLFYKDDGLSLRGVSFAQYPFRASESHTCSYGR